MTSHYKILRPVTPADLKPYPRFVKLLKMIPPDGYVTASHFKNIDKYRVRDVISYACSCGILMRVSPHDRVLKLNSVKF